jgi:hypothetical protein
MIWRQSGELDEYSLVLYKSNYNTWICIRLCHI